MEKHTGDSQLSHLLESASRIQQLKVLHYCIPLRYPLTTAHGTLTTRQGAILEVLTAGGITGIGEIAPLPEFGGGTLNDALVPLHQSPIVNDLVGKGPDEA